MSELKRNWNLLLLTFLFLGLYGQFLLQHTNAGRAIEYLPGFEGPLPFQLETGYIGVDKGEDVQVFYYLTKSESNPKEDPLLFWMTGGPGCSSISALLYEIGPLKFKDVEYDGSLPKLKYNPNSWTKVASIVYIDLPAGTGFTYAKSGNAPHYSDLRIFDQAYEFIRKWLQNHPEFISNPIYIGGDSYSGIPVPIIVQHITNGNEAGINQFINLKGYVLGNPTTNPLPERNYQFEFVHGMGLIPDELYEAMKMSCKGEYREEYIDPNNLHCLQYNKAYDECLKGIHAGNILEPECGFLHLRPKKSIRKRSALEERMDELYTAKQSLSASPCSNVEKELSSYWANDYSVQDALHIKKGSIEKWTRCNRTILTYTILDVRSYHANLSNKGVYRALIYSGDHDMIVTHQSTQAWIKALNYSIVDEWRQWRVDGQIAGYTRSYSNNMTYATVKGGGHTAPTNRPGECIAMFERWISHEPL